MHYFVNNIKIFFVKYWYILAKINLNNKLLTIHKIVNKFIYMLKKNKINKIMFLKIK